MRVLISASLSTLVIIFLFDYNHPSGCEVIFHGFDLQSSITDDIECFFMFLLDIANLEKCVFRSFAYFKIGLFLFILGCKSSLYILDTRPLSDISFAILSVVFSFSY